MLLAEDVPCGTLPTSGMCMKHRLGIVEDPSGLCENFGCIKSALGRNVFNFNLWPSHCKYKTASRKKCRPVLLDPEHCAVSGSLFSLSSNISSFRRRPCSGIVGLHKLLMASCFAVHLNNFQFAHSEFSAYCSAQLAMLAVAEV